MTKEIRIGSMDREILVFVSPFLKCFTCGTPLIKRRHPGVNFVFICPKCDHKSRRAREREKLTKNRQETDTRNRQETDGIKILEGIKERDRK